MLYTPLGGTRGQLVLLVSRWAPCAPDLHAYESTALTRHCEWMVVVCIDVDIDPYGVPYFLYVISGDARGIWMIMFISQTTLMVFQRAVGCLVAALSRFSANYRHTLFVMSVTSSICQQSGYMGEHGRRHRGDGGDVSPPVRNSGGDVPPRNRVF